MYKQISTYIETVMTPPVRPPCKERSTRTFSRDPVRDLRQVQDLMWHLSPCISIQLLKTEYSTKLITNHIIQEQSLLSVPPTLF